MAGGEYSGKAVSSVCLNCGDAFTYTHATGRKKAHCSNRCRNKHRDTLAKMRVGGLPACKAEGCDRPATRLGHGLCEMHYYRLRRTGVISKRPHRPRIHSGGYVLVKAGHPLAQSNGWVYQHRQVAYDQHGGECPPCHWCNALVDWATCHIDHLNGDKADNRSANLVVTCAKCNRSRGMAWPFLLSLSADRLEHLVRLIEADRGG